MLTPKQQAVFDFICQHHRETGIWASSRVIQRRFGFSQTAAVGYQWLLGSKGLLEQLSDGSWGKKPREAQTRLIEIPVFGTVPAGRPNLQEQEPEERISIDPAAFGHRRFKPDRLWGLRVSGDSMVEAHILDGDIAVLEKREARPGEIVAALVDDNLSTLKRLIQAGRRLVLHPENRALEDVIPKHSLEIQGVYIGVISRAQR